MGRPMSKEASRAATIAAIQRHMRQPGELDNATKKFLVVSYYSLHKMDVDVIHRGTGFALDFIYNTLREFAHRCVVRSVRERIAREIPKD